MVTRFIFIFALVVAVQGSWSLAQTPLSRDEQTLLERAKELVATETGVAADSLTLVSLEAVKWNDASLGCPQPGTMYAQVVTPGYRITLQGPKESYDVHTAAAPEGNFVLCDQAETSATRPFRTGPFKLPAVPEPSTADSLTGVLWQWQTDRLTDTSNYTLEFLPDNQLVFQADCNRGRAHYETFGENGLRVDSHPSRRAPLVRRGRLPGRLPSSL